MHNRKKILIADDDLYVHEILTYVLFLNEFEVMHAYDGLETLKSVVSEKPDLIVLDIMMPRGDGRDICRDLRKGPHTMDIPILMLSGRAEQHDRINGLEVGADEYMTKPFSPNHVVRQIRRMFAKQRGDQ
jgi:DNA-binding response OmpR family regulator